MSTFIPEEIMVNILKRLPVKSILRFRCVCKLWFTLLHDTDFVNMHLNYHLSTENDNLSLMLISAIYSPPLKCSNHYFYSINYDSSSLLCDEVLKIDNPFESPKHAAAIIGSCNGLLCITNCDDLIYIWNPSTKECKKIPFKRNPNDCIVRYEFDYIVRYGFGYDCKINDYKLVRIMGFKGIPYCEVEVFTLGSNKWRRIQNIPSYKSERRCKGVLVNGALHWMVTYHNLISFDLGDETFKQVPLPELEEHHMSFKDVDMVGGHLCIYGQIDECSEAGFEIWVMKDYGVRESWIKLFTIAPQIINRIFSDLDLDLGVDLRCLRLIQSFKNGEILFWVDGKALVVYDPKHEIARTLDIHVVSDWFSVKSYVGSLVSLNSGTYM